MSHSTKDALGPLSQAGNALADARAAAARGDIAAALEQLEQLALDAPSPMVCEACERELAALLDGVTTPEQLASYHRAQGYLALAQDEAELAAAHLSFSLRFDASEQALQTLNRIRERKGRNFPITTYDDAMRLLVSTHVKLGPVERIVSRLKEQLAQARQQDDAAQAQRVSNKLYDLTLDSSYLL